MEKELNEIRNKFQGGKHKAIDELRTLIDNFPTDDLLYKAHDLLGDFLNFLGQHVEAVQSWSNALKSLEDNPGGIDQLNEQKFLDWIDISLAIARTTHCQGLLNIIKIDFILTEILFYYIR
jgi:tetratricopeptide (TPR) repeat protein